MGDVNSLQTVLSRIVHLLFKSERTEETKGEDCVELQGSFETRVCWELLEFSTRMASQPSGKSSMYSCRASLLARWYLLSFTSEVSLFILATRYPGLTSEGSKLDFMLA